MPLPTDFALNWHYSEIWFPNWYLYGYMACFASSK